ncbi:ankyrin repeat domain-containing protein 42 isoform X3 [Hydra vulgaris]
MKDSRNKTVGHLACSHGHSTILEIYLKQGQDTEHQDYLGWTAAHTSVYHGTLDCLNILIKHDCDIEAIDNDGNSLIHLCCIEGQVDCLKVLCNCAKSIGILTLLTLLQNPNDKGQTPKMVAVQNLNDSCVELIMDTIKSVSEQFGNKVDSNVDKENVQLNFSNDESLIEEKKCETEDKVQNCEKLTKESGASDIQVKKEAAPYINLSKKMLLATLEEKDRVIRRLSDYLEFERIRREKLEAQMDENRIYIRNLLKLTTKNQETNRTLNGFAKVKGNT